MKLRQAVTALGIVGLVLAAGFLYSRSAHFRLSELRVQSGVPALTKRVESQLVPLLGQNLLTIGLLGVRRDLESIPRVKSVRLRRVWPNILDVRVEERDAVALTFQDGVLYKIDDRGDLIEPMNQVEGLPLFQEFSVLKDTLPENLRPSLFGFLNLRISDSGAGFLSLKRVDFVRWSAESGLELEWIEDSCRVLLGFENWHQRWFRSVQSADTLLTRGIRPLVLDAAYRSRVVVLKHQKLQNFESGLDLNELARRKEPLAPVSAR